MNSTPAASKARRIASSLAAVREVSRSATSARLIVFTPNDASRAKSTALHRRSARAARIWAPDNGAVFILTCHPYGLFHPIWGDRIEADIIGLEDWYEIPAVDNAPLARRTPLFHRRLGRPDHHGR